MHRADLYQEPWTGIMNSRIEKSWDSANVPAQVANTATEHVQPMYEAYSVAVYTTWAGQCIYLWMAAL